MAIDARTSTTHEPVGRAAALLLLAGGVGFFAGGGLHPKDDGHGDKLAQLHSMLVDPAWYPAHVVLLVGMTGFAAGIVALRWRGGQPRHLERLLAVAAPVAVVAALGAVVHLFAATQATAIEDGSSTWLVHLFTGVETVVNPVWGVTIAALAAVGATAGIGNRVVAPLGVVGGLAYALAVATIAFTDTFDVLFPVGSLLGLWAVAVAVVAGSPSIHRQMGSPKGR
ncbi:MAG TPA: hypothetical protein VNS55_07845 [Nocardioides sp.]|nr:hypothetical protein [Nocardioides sp.]